MLGSPYQGYLYAYPHKTAYRPLRPRPALADVWADEPTDALFLYVHVPYCEMRCGFCNLFTRANPPTEQVTAYLRQLAGQAERVTAALGTGTGTGARYARAAIGGGTPTYLTAGELTALFDLLERATGADLRAVPLSVETSPATATPDRLAVLVDRGATRISIGVQSFDDREAHAAGRPQRRAEVDGALDAIRASGVATLNVDLIYGIPGQTAESWERSLRTALTWAPEELYLYPLYVRPLTGLGRRAAGEDPAPDPEWDAQRMSLYLRAVDLLGTAGYRQESMRMFRRSDAPEAAGPEYCCQDDGMVGLGCGARSYTRALHYSFDYAVGMGAVRGIIADYLGRPATDFDVAEVGFALDEVEQRRRWVLKSLLRAPGLSTVDYVRRFGTGLFDDFPALGSLADGGYLTSEPEPEPEPELGPGSASGVVKLTAAGLAHSDAIGPWLVSAEVRRAMTAYAPR